MTTNHCASRSALAGSKGFSDTMEIGSVILTALVIMLILLVIVVGAIILLTLGVFIIGFCYNMYNKYGGGESDNSKG